MKKIIFVCHGNICRSAMAEMIFNYYNQNKDYIAISRATSYEEIGSDMYYAAKEIMDKNNIPYYKHHATRITRQEYQEAYKVFVMDKNNYINLERIVFDNIKTSYLGAYLHIDEIEDPWYTRRFQLVFDEIKAAVLALIKELNK